MKATAATIAAVQRPDGGIPWQTGGHLDPWNHIEAAMGLDVAGLHAEAEAAYGWLARNQRPDGSWAAEYRGDEISLSTMDTNFTAYAAVGVRHHFLLSGDHSFVERLWPTVDRALDAVVRRQQPSGAIPWRTDPGVRLIAGCSSIHHALTQASALASELSQERPHWESSARSLRTALVGEPDLFAVKPHAMDWYYPILGSVVTGSVAAERIAGGWDRFVEPGLGVRCVDHEPWATGGETAELALTLAARGDRTRAAELLDCVTRLRHDDGSYWTGYQFSDQEFWPDERTTWTAGAVLLATAALEGDPATCTVFGEQVPDRDAREGHPQGL
ncbi:prenyltransferase/squalene oxidase repeat-containing protein [Amycolatopsis sp. lyj-112]|uniref:prenyltransferase/squalene oxidase repeat-containing protein n=1 Tax=Amycolatopsis sp. lyj-112 TaxID=2789288 RepID=UPI0039798EDF